MSKKIDVQVGDRVRVIYEGRVTDVSHTSGGLCLDGALYVNLNDAGTVERLSTPKPKEGDVITGRQLRNIKWKRGSIVTHGFETDFPGWVLHGDGTWHSLSDKRRFPFDEFAERATYLVKHVA